MAKQKDPNKTGLMILLVCGLIAVALIVGCIFFPEEIFGFFMQ